MNIDLDHYRNNRWRRIGDLPVVDRIEPLTTALIVIDMQNWDSHPDYGRRLWKKEEGYDYDAYWDRVEGLVVPNHVRLLEAFRAAGGRIVFTVPAAYFLDCADANPNNRDLWRRADAVVGKDTCEIRAELTPRLGEAVIPKVSSDAWSSSGIDYVLRNAGVTRLFFTGVVTDGCVLNSAAGAWGHGYEVHVVEDATATFTEARHRAALERICYFMGLCSIDEVIEALPSAAPESA